MQAQEVKPGVWRYNTTAPDTTHFTRFICKKSLRTTWSRQMFVYIHHKEYK